MGRIVIMREQGGPSEDWQGYDQRAVARPLQPEKLDWFSGNIPKDGEILDFGAGIARWGALLASIRPDIKIDVLDERADQLSQYYDKIAQIKHRMHESFENFRAEGKQYDGIWARSSLCFLTADQLPPVLTELAKSLTTGGVLECNFVQSKPDDSFPLIQTIDKATVGTMLTNAGFAIEQVIDERHKGYDKAGTYLPAYIIRARKK